ncbi:MAG: hypothetical protein PHE17_06175 [Thiothrix sp.]|uniref:tetratricopeptide repeat protein n=1 Tax=Thiothrix sp. TaxID=1032 RepID=UPI00261C8213|nr:tetratricopeptide repeat protein [Thiothrix sp.]MDD5392588.1 hypothetical protein [Thiothrix sp.]
MRRLLFASVLLLAACGDKQEVSQSSKGDYSPNVVAGGNVSVQQTNIQNATINMPPELVEKLAQALKAQGTPADQLNAQLEELKRKYADLQQKLGEYAKTDELAQQARKELDTGNLEQAETLLQQAYDKDLQFSKQHLAQRALDLAEVAELRLDHDKALARYREVTQLQPDNLIAWKNVYDIAQKVGNNNLALEAAQGLQKNLRPEDEDWLYMALADEGTALEKLGDTAKAMEKYLVVLEFDKKRTVKFPEDAARQHNLSVSYNKVGSLYKANGAALAAMKSYQNSLSIAQKLVDLDPKQADWQHDLSVSYQAIGDLQVVNGDKAAALKSYQYSLSIRKKLVILDPKRADWQHDLSVSYERLGDMYQANGDTPAALKSYQDSLSVRKKLVILDPKRADWQYALSVSYERLGDMYQANGDTPAALKSYQDSLSVIKRLVDLNPKRADWQYALSVSYERLGDMYQANGDTPAALKSYQDSLSIIKRLVDLNPKQTDWQRALSVKYHNLGGIYRANGDAPAVLKSYQDSLAISKKLAELDPEVVQWQVDLAWSYYRLAQVQEGNRKNLLKSALNILKKLDNESRLVATQQIYDEILFSGITQLDNSASINETQPNVRIPVLRPTKK